MDASTAARRVTRPLTPVRRTAPPATALESRPSSPGFHETAEDVAMARTPEPPTGCMSRAVPCRGRVSRPPDRSLPTHDGRDARRRGAPPPQARGKTVAPHEDRPGGPRRATGTSGSPRRPAGTTPRTVSRSPRSHAITCAARSSTRYARSSVATTWVTASTRTSTPSPISRRPMRTRRRSTRPTPGRRRTRRSRAATAPRAGDDPGARAHRADPDGHRRRHRGGRRGGARRLGQSRLPLVHDGSARVRKRAA